METLPCANQLQEHQQPQQQLVNLSIDASLGENVVSIPKELILISLVSQEQSLYNPKHPNYRSTKTKDEKWLEIGSNVGWSGELVPVAPPPKITPILLRRCAVQVQMEGHEGSVLPGTQTREGLCQSGQVEVLQGAGLPASICAGKEVSWGGNRIT